MKYTQNWNVWVKEGRLITSASWLKHITRGGEMPFRLIGDVAMKQTDMFAKTLSLQQKRQFYETLDAICSWYATVLLNNLHLKGETRNLGKNPSKKSRKK